MKIKNVDLVLDKLKRKFDKKDKIIFITIIIIGLICNFYFIINDGLSPDSLFPTHFFKAGAWEKTLGRFSLIYFNEIKFTLVSNLINIIFSLIFIAISVMLIKRIFNIKNLITLILISMIFTIAPQFIETYFFIYCADAYLFAFMLSILSVYFLNKGNLSLRKNEKIKLYIYSMVCIIIVPSIYQAYLGVVLSLTIILFLFYLINNINIKKIFINFIINITLILIGVIIYYLILKIILKLDGLTLTTYKGANQLGDIFKNLPKSIIQAYKDIYYFFFTDKIINNSIYMRKHLYLGLFITNNICFILLIYKNKLQNKIIRTIFAIILLIIYPLFANIMDIIASSTTINLVTGSGILITSTIILFYDLLKDENIDNIIKYITYCIYTILIFTFLIQNTYTYISRAQTHKNAVIIASDIYTKVTSFNEYDSKYPWMFSDIIKYRIDNPERGNGFNGNNFEMWADYNGISNNIPSFYQRYLGIKIKLCSKQEYNEIKETQEFKNMAIYPEKGCIKLINNVIVIKMSNITY